MVKSINKQVPTGLFGPCQDSSGHYKLLLTPAEKVENFKQLAQLSAFGFTFQKLSLSFPVLS